MHKGGKGVVVDLVVLVLITLLATWMSFLIQANFLTSTLLFLGAPSIYLIAVEKRSFAKVFIAALIAGLLCGFVFDFLAEVNHAWSWNGGLLLGQVAGVVQGDVLIWFFLWMLNIFLVYEHFIDGSKSHSVITKYGLRSLLIAIGLAAMVLILNKYYSQALHFNKAYLVICLLVIVPLLYYGWKKPRIVLHTLPVTILFTFIYLLHEITSLRLGQWQFSGDYVGWVHLAGVSFPIEELLFWVVLSGLVGSVYFEMYFDNHRQ